MNLKEKVLSGQRICGCMGRFVRNPAMVFLAKNAGIDFIMFDLEHGFLNIETVHDMLCMCKSLDMGGFIRATAPGKGNISPYLDAGATGVLMPLTETAEEAQSLVRWSKYADLGTRGFCGGLVPASYATGMSHREVMDYGNSNVLTIAQIETRLGVENAYEIAAVDGVDALFVGPNDLSLSLGIPGDVMNPIEIEAIERVIDACHKYGKAFAILSGPPLIKHFKEYIDIAMLNLADLDLLRNGFKSMKAAFDDCFAE